MNLNTVVLRMLSTAFAFYGVCSAETLRYHTLVVDGQDKIIPWFTPTTNAFDNYLVNCWSWALAAPNDSHGLPISFLYCAWNPGNPPTADTSWENDVGEKIPHWVESARLYYQYSGDMAPLNYVRRLVDYSLDHGQTPATHAWPDIPVGTANAGDTEFRGFTGVWSLWDCHIDLAAHIGLSMYRMYQMYGDIRYRDKAVHVADVLAARMVTGNATVSPWPYVVNSQTGAIKSGYAASWDGALELFDVLIEGGQGNVSGYGSARTTLKNWLLTYPMQNGNWVDGHSDVRFDGTGNWSATCASDMCLYLLEHPSWDPNFLVDVRKLLKWAEDNFVNVLTPDGLAGQYHGAYVPAEQTAYMYRMGYQAARLGAQYALWYKVSGDATYKDRAYRCLSYNTYMMQANGQSSDGPTDTVGYWWSDCYGEAPWMYHYALGAVPEWAPADQNHLLHSSSVVTSVTYASNSISYTTFNSGADETLRVAFTPVAVVVDGVELAQSLDLNQPGWVFTASNGVLRIRHDTGTNVQILDQAPGDLPLTITTVSLPNGIVNAAYSASLTASGGTKPYLWALANGTMPADLTLNGTSGAITGTPAAAGALSLTVQVSDASDPAQTATKVLSLFINPALTSVAVTPVNPSILTGGALQFTATGIYSDGSMQDLTSQTTWTSSSTAVATISASGLATGISAGTATISAALGGKTGSTTLTILPIPEGVGDYRSASSGVWANAAIWQTNNGTAWVAASRPPTNNTTAGVITVQNGHTVTVASSVTVDQVLVEAGGQVTVNSGQTLTIANGTGTDLSVSGTLQNAGTVTLRSGATIAFDSGGTYQHSLNAGTIPAATWNAASTCLITGTTSTLPSGLDQGFGHFTWNCASQSAALDLETSMSIAGNFKVSATGTGTLRLLNSTMARTMTVGGNFNQTGGTFNLKNSSGAAVLNVAGNFSQAGGTFTLRSGTATGSGTVNVAKHFSLSAGTFNLSSVRAAGTLNVGGNFSHTGGTITESSSGSGAIIFTSGLHTNTSGGTLANTINFTVNSGATLMLGTSLLGNGSRGTFTLASGGTLGIGDPAGITTSGATGNIRVTGTRTYNAGASYIYNGTVPQVPGNGLPATVNNLTIANAAGLTVNSTNAVSGVGSVNPGARLLGTGRLNSGPLILSGTVAPGLSVGRFTTARETWNGAASYNWEINNATGTPATGWDLLSLTSGQGIDVQSATTNPFTLKLITLNGSSPGLAANFDKTNTYTWTIAVATNATVTNFAADKFVVDATQFSNDFGGGTFSVEQSGAELRLKFTAAPSGLTIGTTSLPDGSQNVPYTATLTAGGGITPYTWSIAGGSLPAGLALNAASGAIGGTPVAVGVFNFTAGVSDSSNPVQTVTKALSITVVPTLTSITVTPTNSSILTGGTQQFTATGTYSDGSTQNLSSLAAWTSSSSTVAAITPNGLATGLSVGTTTISALLAGVSNSVLLTVQAPLVVTTISLPSGTVSTPYTTTLTASGGTAPYTWSLASGLLPSGLTLNAASGTISGTPATAGTSSFTVQASDASIPVKTATKPLSITVAPILTSIALIPANPTNVVGTTRQFTATGTYSDGTTQNLTSQATWASSSTTIATINSSGLATGVTAGITTISATLGGVNGTTTLTIQPLPLTITTTSLPNGTVSTTYTATLAASGGTAPYTWSLASGFLPSGLTLNATSGAITGTPTVAGTSNLTVQVSDATIPVETATMPLSITIINFASTTGTIGNTNEGTLTDYLWDSGAWINACRVLAASNMTISTMRAKVAAIPGKYQCAIYTDSSSRPNRLLRGTTEVSNPSNGWQFFPLTSSLGLTNGQYYWLAIWSDDANARVYYSGNNGTLRWGSYNYGTWPDPISTTGGGSFNYCIYATQ